MRSERSYDLRRWSKLQKKLYDIIDESIDLQIHLTKYRMKSNYGATSLPRYWITLGDEIIFDYPARFVGRDGNVRNYSRHDADRERYFHLYPYVTDISDISELIGEYISTPKELLFTHHFENDFWGLTNILKAADRRIGKRRLEILRRRTHNKAALKIIGMRLGNDKISDTVR